MMYSYNLQYIFELLYFAGGYPDWTHTQHHAGFDIVANRILEVINNYYTEVSRYFDSDIEILDDNTIETAITANSVSNYSSDIVDGGVCFWITGHSMGAGVANLVAANLIDKGYRDNVYCYTYAAPNTFYWSDNESDNYKEPKGVNYRCIFNIVNDDDFVPKLPMEACEWTKYGRTGNVSINVLNHTKNSLKLSTYNFKQRHEFDEYTMSSLISNNEKFLYSAYSGDADEVDKVIKEFSNIYLNNENEMRRDTYTYSNDYEYYENVSLDSIMRDISGYNKYSLPYLKKERDGYRTKLVQMPAYFMNIVAGGMHNNNNDGETIIFPIFNHAQIKFTQLAKRYVGAREQLVNSNSKIEMPHYLESYYILTKEINTTDFR